MAFEITGMTCSACSARVEKGVAQLEGVARVEVNLLRGAMTVVLDGEGVTGEDIIRKVEEMGYGAAVKGAAKARDARPESDLQDLKKRLIASLAFTFPLFYLSMGEMAGWPIPGMFTGMENALVYAFTLFLLAAPVVVLNRSYFQGGLRNLFRRSPNMDSLIAIGSGASFAYGIYAVYRIGWGLGHGDLEAVHRFSMDLYFESSAMILTLITLGKFLEARAKGRTTAALSKLMDLTPALATVVREGEEREIPVEEVLAGDLLVVREGTAIPVDGVLVEGWGAVDESAITGESLPVEKNPGDPLTGGTVSGAGYFRMEAKAVGGDTTLAKIIRLVDEATSSKAPVAKLADKISGVFVPVVMAIALGAFLTWLLLGRGFEFAMTAGISVLVISCPCALGLATPTAIMVGAGKGAAGGILIKSAEALEGLHNVDTVVLDKTGTVTEGKPMVTDLFPQGVSREELLALAASLETGSGHPLAAPIVARAREEGLPLYPVEDYRLIPGRGIVGTVQGAALLGGNRRLMEERNIPVSSMEEVEAAASSRGRTLLYFARENQLLGAVEAADAVKPTSRGAVAQLKGMGLEVVLLTGDNQAAAQAIGEQVGISRVVAQALPADKDREIRRLQEEGRRVTMVGDGINDAPALVRADVGVAIGAGTDIAMESADIVLMKSDLWDVAAAIRLSRAVMRNIRQNLFWAFLYNVIGIPVAAGVFYPAFGWLLSPMVAAAAMSLSSVSVVANALRLNLFQFPRPEPQPAEQKERTVTKTLTIQGMSCGHCAASVTKALEPLAAHVAVNLEEKTATVALTDPSVTDQALRAAVEAAGYPVTEIR